MRLLVNGSSIAVAQMGPDFLLVDGPIDHPPGNASLVLQVDQSERRWDVHLPEGICCHVQAGRNYRKLVTAPLGFFSSTPNCVGIHQRFNGAALM